MDKPTFTFGSLFSGIGGLDLGLERAGFKIAWQCEIDDYATKVLAKHWPDVTRFRDVRTVGRHIGDIHSCYLPVADVDGLAGGFPCQPHSQAGERKASQDERDLWPEFYRLIRELEPRWVVAENVLGLLSSEDGAFFGGILRDLATAGYDAAWRVLSAAQFGAPHLRERVIVVAHYTGQRSGAWRPESAKQCGTTIAVSDGSPDVANANGRGCRETGQRGMGKALAEWRDATNNTPEAQNTGINDVADANSNDGRWSQRTNAGSVDCQGRENTEGERYPQRDADQCSSSPLAYAGSPEWWPGAERRSNVADWTDAGWQETPGGFEFCGEELANTSSSGRQELDVTAIAGGQGHAAWRKIAPGTERPVEDSTGRRERQYQSAGGSQGTQSLVEQSGAWAVESRMGRATHGISRWLDGYRWPARPGQNQEAWEAPRVVTEKKINRTARLKGLGNAVLVALAESVGRDIMAAEMAEKERVA